MDTCDEDDSMFALFNACVSSARFLQTMILLLSVLFFLLLLLRRFGLFSV